jgi:hypothetical protein
MDLKTAHEILASAYENERTIKLYKKEVENALKEIASDILRQMNCVTPHNPDFVYRWMSFRSKRLAQA